MRKLIRILIGVVLLAALGGGLRTPAGASSPSEEGAFVARINSLRASKGLAPLQVDGGLTAIARGWSEHMAAAGGISHNPSLASQVNGSWQKLGENVGVGSAVDNLFQAFVNSPSHYHNLVDPSFTHVGVGVVWSNGQLYTTHDFMTRAAAPAPPPPPPPPPTTIPPSPPPPPTTVALPPPAPSPSEPAVPAATATDTSESSDAGAADKPSTPAPVAAPSRPEPQLVAAVLAGLRQLDTAS